MTDCIISANGITLRSSGYFAGAFDSLIWNGMEFLDRADHGRLLQSACAFDDLGEAYNPTEGGSGEGVSSIILSRECSGNHLHGQTKMAFWKPVSGAVYSDHVLTRNVTIGHLVSPNIIQYKVSFNNPENHSYGQFEALTGYMPPPFKAIYNLDVKTGEIARAETNKEAWDIPGIMATEDGQYAMGCYSKDSIGIYTGFTDAEVTAAGCTKWNMVFREKPCPKGDYAYEMYVIVGTLEGVRSDMVALHNYFNGGNMSDIVSEYLRFRQYYKTLGLNPSDEEYHNVVNTIGDSAEQCREFKRLYLEAVQVDKDYANYLYDLWVKNLDDTQNLLNVMVILASQTPESEGWKPPEETKVVCELPGPFFMSGMPFPDGLRIGTYKDSAGIARLYKYDCAFHELWSGHCESVYHIQRRKNGKVMFSTECPAGIGIEGDDGTITWRQLRGEPDSLAFDIWPYKGGWMVFTVRNVLYGGIKIFTSQDDGVTWQLYREHSCNNGIFKQCCTDGQTYYLYGHKDRFPYIEREDGKQVIWMKDYKDQEINNAAVADDLFTIGMNNIDALIEDGTRRNGYVMYGTTGGMYHSGIDLKAPWIMQTDIFPQGRYAIASIWNEGGYPNPEIAYSKDGRTGWAQIASVPFPSVQTMDYGDGGIYSFGGQYGQFGKVHFLKV